MLLGEVAISQEGVLLSISDTGLFSPAFKRIVVGFMAAFIVLVGAQTVVAAPSQAESTGFYGRECTVKALSGEGVKSNGCNAYGPAHWISTTSGNTEIAEWAKACIHGGKWAVIVLPFSKVGPQGLIGATFLGCAQSVADELLSN